LPFNNAANTGQCEGKITVPEAGVDCQACSAAESVVASAFDSEAREGDICGAVGPARRDALDCAGP